MTREVSNEALLEIVGRTAPELLQQVEQVLRSEVSDITRVTRGKRADLLKIYSHRRASLKDHGVDPQSIDAVLDRLRSHAGEYVWGFGLHDDTQALVGFIDDDLHELVALLVLPRNVEALYDRF